jgi:hypothetical protein
MSDEPDQAEKKVKSFMDLFPPVTPEEEAESQRLRDETFAAANDATPDIEWEWFGGAVPEQGFGWWIPTGEAVYFRVRHDYARLEVGDVDPDVKPGHFFYPSVKNVRLTASVSDIGGYGSTEGPEHTRQTIRTLRAMLRPVDEPADPSSYDRTEAFIRQLKQLEELYTPSQVT